MPSRTHYDLIVIGAGAAGMMTAITAGQRGLSVLVIERNPQIGSKIRISGGSRCNFTNLNTNPENYISMNPHFMRSALAQYKPEDFIALVHKHQIKYHEKKLGQLFCDISSEDIIDLLNKEASLAKVEFLCNCTRLEINHNNGFELKASGVNFFTDNLVIATGGLSIPKLGASSFGYDIAKKFGHSIIPTHPALVALLIDEPLLTALAGLSMDVEVQSSKYKFRENILFTHKGISGPAALQISSYIQPGDCISINYAPDHNIYEFLREAKKNTQQNKKQIKNILREIPILVNSITAKAKLNRENIFPDKFVDVLELMLEKKSISLKTKLAETSQSTLEAISKHLHQASWQITDYAGYSQAEVTRGGVNTKEINSKNMESKLQQGLYFVGEVLDVTGWLGGYNLQWAWASGYVCGRSIENKI